MGMREEFEAWVVQRAVDTPTGFYPQLIRRSTLDPDVYMISWVDSAWEGWQASRAALVKTFESKKLKINDDDPDWTLSECWNNGITQCQCIVDPLITRETINTTTVNGSDASCN